MSRLKAAWSDPHVSPQESQMRATHGGPDSCPVSPGVALVAYVRHGITKMNTNLGFSLHIPGMGRQPVAIAEQERHALLLGDALVAAIARDFAPGHRNVAVSAPPIRLVSPSLAIPCRATEVCTPRCTAEPGRRLPSAHLPSRMYLISAVSSRPACLAMSHNGRRPTSPNSPPLSQKLAITPKLVSELAQTHLRACIYYQNELGNALARANVEGEEARRQERLRIWGFAS